MIDPNLPSAGNLGCLGRMRHIASRVALHRVSAIRQGLCSFMPRQSVNGNFGWQSMYAEKMQLAFQFGEQGQVEFSRRADMRVRAFMSVVVKTEDAMM